MSKTQSEQIIQDVIAIGGSVMGLTDQEIVELQTKYPDGTLVFQRRSTVYNARRAREREMLERQHPLVERADLARMYSSRDLNMQKSRYYKMLKSDDLTVSERIKIERELRVTSLALHRINSSMSPREIIPMGLIGKQVDETVREHIMSSYGNGGRG